MIDGTRKVLRRAAKYGRRHLRAARAEIRARRFPVMSMSQKHSLDAPLVITLTSYPARFPNLHKTLRTLLDQTVRPDRTVLWLSRDDEPLVPERVRELTRHGLEIRTCDDLKSYKKLVPALREWPECYLLTADDDLSYEPTWVETLVSSVNPSTPRVLCRRAHRLRWAPPGELLPYRDWDRCVVTGPDPSGDILPTTGAGVLYPPGSLPALACDEALFMELCPTADDIWFYWMVRLNGWSISQVGGPCELVEWYGNGGPGLFAHNGTANDGQAQAMLSRFGSPLG